ncbi:MAG: hypothetical protein QM778_04080 [Myxococcales bacterium]
MSYLSRTSLCALTFALAATAFGCDDGAVDRVDNRLDCRGICDAYHTCIDDDTDLDDCRDSCVDKALEDDKWESKVDHCADCVSDDDSCTEKTFHCLDECVGIVP